MKAVIKSIFGIKFKTATHFVNYPSLLEYVAYPMVKFIPIVPAEFPKTWDQGKYLVQMKLFGVIPLGKQNIVIEKVKENKEEFILRDNGSGELIRVWDHLITIKKVGDNMIHYKDEVSIDAGLLTPFIWMYAMVFYHWRQLRWKRLISTNFKALKKTEPGS